jgi:hypothetical protein
VLLVTEEIRLVEGRSGKSFDVGVGWRADWVPFLANVRLTLLSIDLLLLLLPFLVLVLVIFIIGILSNKMIGLTALEAWTLSPWFVLVGVVLASLQSGLGEHDHKCHLVLIKVG